MRQYVLQDCYYELNTHQLIVGNNRIERCYEFVQNHLTSLFVRNKQTGYTWRNPESSVVSFHLAGFNQKEATWKVEATTEDNDGLSQEAMVVRVVFSASAKTVVYSLTLFPVVPFITSRLYVQGLEERLERASLVDVDRAGSTGIEKEPESNPVEELVVPEEDTIEAIPLNERHLKLETIRFFDGTDCNDFLVKASEELLYRGPQRFSGNMFVIKHYLAGEGLMVVKEAPTIEASLFRRKEDLEITANSMLSLRGCGLDTQHLPADTMVPCYGATVGVGGAESLKEQYKSFYDQLYRGDISRNLFVMSNTWGDRSQDRAVCESFLLQELETAAALGVDIVQIDDGWQQGFTANSALKKGGVWEGYYDFDRDFWTVNTEKFPNGLEPLVASANKHGIKLGLWFSPDSSHDFANWQKDADVLLGLYRQYDIRYFKFDGIKIRSKASELNLVKLMRSVSRDSGNQVSFNLDITAEVRFGYLYEKQFGTIFVENRYTDWGNYYPHRTLKNVWLLAQVLPTRKFQFEVLNSRRNLEKYSGDPLAPSHYSIDYLFASTMVANPLLWMEMSNLHPQDRDRLQAIISVYRQERSKIFHGRVVAVGDLPDGTNHTGFQVVVDESHGYLVLFRERNSEPKYEFTLVGLANSELELQVLATNAQGISLLPQKRVVSETGKLKVMLPQPFTYVFLKYAVT